jgi:hypothetical protein
MIEYMQQKGGVWFATMEEIARHAEACAAAGTWQPRSVRLPYYDGPIAAEDRPRRVKES